MTQLLRDVLIALKQSHSLMVKDVQNVKITPIITLPFSPARNAQPIAPITKKRRNASAQKIIFGTT